MSHPGLSAGIGDSKYQPDGRGMCTGREASRLDHDEAWSRWSWLGGSHQWSDNGQCQSDEDDRDPSSTLDHHNLSAARVLRRTRPFTAYHSGGALLPTRQSELSW